MNLENKARLYYLDWLRVFSYAVLVGYHAALVFVDWDSHIKNPVISDAFKFPMQFINPWRMPMLFLISGAGVCFALGQRSGTEFLWDRTRRLLIPLAFGMLVLLPPQFYIDRLHEGYTGSFMTFYADHLAHLKLNRWSHLWFIAYLFVFVLAALPIFLYLRSERGRALTARISELLTRYRLGLLLLTTIPLFVIEWTLHDLWPERRRFVGDWYNVTFFFTTFLYGFVLASSSGALWPAIERDRRWYLITGIVGFVILFWVWYSNGDIVLQRPRAESPILKFIWCLNCMAWILAALGYARRYFNFSHPVLPYATRAALPFYVLHNLVLIALAYFVVRIDTGVFLKFLLVTLGTFLGTFVIYEGIVRRVKALHIFFGIR